MLRTVEDMHYNLRSSLVSNLTFIFEIVFAIVLNLTEFAFFVRNIPAFDYVESKGCLQLY